MKGHCILNKKNSPQYTGIFLSALFFLIFASIVPAAYPEDNYISQSLTGSVNWSKGYIEAKGSAVLPKNMSKGQAKAMGERGAIADAQRNLLETIKGVRVVSDTTVENYIVKNDTIKTKVEGLLRGAVKIKTTVLDDGSIEVIMRAPFIGKKNSLNKIFLKEIAELSKQTSDETTSISSPAVSGNQSAEKKSISPKTAKSEQKTISEPVKTTKKTTQTSVTPKPSPKPSVKTTTKSDNPPITSTADSKEKSISTNPKETPKDTPKEASKPAEAKETSEGKNTIEPKNIPETKPTPDSTPEKKSPAETKSEVKPETKPEQKSETKPEIKPETKPEQKSEKKSESAGQNSSTSSEPTGIVIDASNLSIQPALAPRIFSEQGEEVYGPSVIDRDKTINNLICCYVTSKSAAMKHDKVKSTPQIFTAIGVKNRTDFIITNDDAASIKNDKKLKEQVKKLKVVAILD